MQLCLGHVLRNHKVVSKNKRWLLLGCLLGAVAHRGILASGVSRRLRGLGVSTWERSGESCGHGCRGLGMGSWGGKTAPWRHQVCWEGRVDPASLRAAPAPARPPRDLGLLSRRSRVRGSSCHSPKYLPSVEAFHVLEPSLEPRSGTFRGDPATAWLLHRRLLSCSLSSFPCLARKICFCLSSLERDTRGAAGARPPWSQPSWALPGLLGTVTWPTW